MKRTPIARGTTPLKRTTGLAQKPMARRVSPRVRAYVDDLTDVRPVILARSHGQCESWGFVERWVRSGRCDSIDAELVDEALSSFVARKDECGRTAHHVHHRKYRARLGTNDPDNLIHLCTACHEWTHNNGRLSHVLGLSLHVGDSEAAP